jgi:hypothetical protein
MGTIRNLPSIPDVRDIEGLKKYLLVQSVILNDLVREFNGNIVGNKNIASRVAGNELSFDSNGNLNVVGTSGTFVTADAPAKTVTVRNGVIISIS